MALGVMLRIPEFFQSRATDSSKHTPVRVFSTVHLLAPGLHSYQPLLSCFSFYNVPAWHFVYLVRGVASFNGKYFRTNEVEAQYSDPLIHLKLLYLFEDLFIVHSFYFSPHVFIFLFSYSLCVHSGRRQQCSSYSPPLSLHLKCFFPYRSFCSYHVVICKKQVPERRRQRMQGSGDDRVILLRTMSVEGDLVLSFSLAVALFWGRHKQISVHPREGMEGQPKQRYHQRPAWWTSQFIEINFKNMDEGSFTGEHIAQR